MYVPLVLIEHIGQCLCVVVQYPFEPRSCSPIGDGTLVEPRSGLIWRIPRPTGVGDGQAADIAGNLFTLFCCEAMKPASGDDTGVGEIKILQIASIPSMAVGAARLNRRTMRQTAGS